VPEYLAPGVYIEEVAFRAKSIEGVATSTAGFVGPTVTGPRHEPVRVESFVEFEATFGDRCLVAQAARAFFAQGGRRLFVQRVEDDYARGLQAFERIPQIAIVATPGADVADELVAHATRFNRFAVVDPPKGLTVDEVLEWRRRLDSPYAAVYYPWLVDLAPSGFVAGMYARTDLDGGVWKAPAGEPIAGAIALERDLTEAEIGELASGGVNPLRVLPGGGIVAWAAHTTSSDPEWKYVNVRRYVSYLEHSIDRGTQWTVFEPNGAQLWDDVRDTIASFLAAEFRAGALAGRKPEEAYFVRCDGSTMTQADIDQGLLVCLVGVAAVRPAEFVVIRIGRWTADHQV
jgi:Bacteriophage tail sheath protein